MDKGRTDIILEIDPIVETEVHINIMVETEETIKTRTIIVLEIIEIETGIIKMIDSIIEGIILAKGMTRDLGVPQEKILKADIETIKVEVGKDKGPELYPEREKQGQDLILKLVPVETG